MFTIDVPLTADEAVSLMRMIAAKQWTEASAEKRDDLELIRLRLYDRVYHNRREPIRIDMGCLTHALRPGLTSPGTEHAWRAA